VASVGGLFEEREGVKAELLETLHGGPGEAARREVMVGTSGPAPSRWTLRTVRVSVAKGVPRQLFLPIATIVYAGYRPG